MPLPKQQIEEALQRSASNVARVHEEMRAIKEARLLQEAEPLPRTPTLLRPAQSGIVEPKR